MIPLKIKKKSKGSANNKTIKVPTFDELTVKQLINVTKKQVEKEKKKDPFTIVDYISTVTGKPYKDVYLTKIQGPDVIMQAIGSAKNIEKEKPKKELVIDDNLINVKELSIDTFGQRTMIELNGQSMNTFELYCFILAVGIVEEDNINQVNKLKDNLMNMNYLDILPSAFFLLKNSKIGKKRGRGFLKRFLNIT